MERPDLDHDRPWPNPAGKPRLRTIKRHAYELSGGEPHLRPSLDFRQASRDSPASLATPRLPLSPGLSLPPRWKARIFSKKAGLSHFTPCTISLEDGSYWVDFDGKKAGSSAILTNLLGESGLMLSSSEDTTLQQGTLVHVIILENF